MSGVSGRKERREETPASDRVASLAFLISVPSACSRTSRALEGCLSMWSNASCNVPAVSKVPLPLARTEMLTAGEHELRVHGEKGRSDHPMDLMLCCHPVDTGGAT